VAWREIKERGRSRAYLLTTIATALLVLGVIVVPQMLEGGTADYRVGLVGEGGAAIVERAAQLGNADDEVGADPSVSMSTFELEDREQAESALASGEVDAVLVEDIEVISETGGFTGNSLVELLQRGAAATKLEEILAGGDEEAARVVELMTSEPLTATSLSGDDPRDDTRELVAYAGLLLLYMAILLYGTWILTGVTEEKSNRVVEVLLSGLRPWQLLGGKILGIGFLGMAQFAGTIILGLFALQAVGGIEIPDIGVASVVNLVIWFIIGFLLFAVMFGAAGSLVSRTEDAQTIAFPMSLVAVAGFFVSISALDDPGGMAAVIGTFVPLTAPFVVPVRAALQSIPVWQYAASVVLTLATIIAMVFVAGRIYRGALLRFGGRIKLREAWRGAVE
jgi:ABC-2 type transport system permease protein